MESKNDSFFLTLEFFSNSNFRLSWILILSLTFTYLWSNSIFAHQYTNFFPIKIYIYIYKLLIIFKFSLTCNFSLNCQLGYTRRLLKLAIICNCKRLPSLITVCFVFIFFNFALNILWIRKRSRKYYDFHIYNINVDRILICLHFFYQIIWKYKKRKRKSDRQLIYKICSIWNKIKIKN